MNNFNFSNFGIASSNDYTSGFSGFAPTPQSNLFGYYQSSGCNGISPYQMANYAGNMPQIYPTSTSMSNFINDVAQRNAAYVERSRELAGRYADIQSRVDSNQSWLNNQNGLQRFWNGLNGKTKRVQNDMSRYTRESVGVLAEEVDVLYNQNNMLMGTVAEMANRMVIQEEIHNKQNQVLLDIIRRLILGLD